jgi:hypothetical protein
MHTGENIAACPAQWRFSLRSVDSIRKLEHQIRHFETRRGSSLRKRIRAIPIRASSRVKTGERLICAEHAGVLVGEDEVHHQGRWRGDYLGQLILLCLAIPQESTLLYLN